MLVGRMHVNVDSVDRTSVSVTVLCTCSYKASNIGRHRCLRLVANSEQMFNCRIARRMITMEKVDHYQARAAFSCVLSRSFLLLFTARQHCRAVPSAILLSESFYGLSLSCTMASCKNDLLQSYTICGDYSAGILQGWPKN